jgi:hypothetical protein|tara:strand:+ start:399 stop:503 length:105 start_codon:yes stop_codon:yes gene_type:complete
MKVGFFDRWFLGIDPEKEELKAKLKALESKSEEE